MTVHVDNNSFTNFPNRVTARYDTESFTFYNNTASNNIGTGGGGGSPTASTETNENDDGTNHTVTSSTSTSDIHIQQQQQKLEPVVTVQIQYATTSSGGSIISSSTPSPAAAAPPPAAPAAAAAVVVAASISSTTSTTHPLDTTATTNDSNNRHLATTGTTTNVDQTGIFIWPATYLLCQYLIFEYRTMTTGTVGPTGITTITRAPRTKTTRRNILELGCGCGMVSSVFMKYHLSHQRPPLLPRDDDDDNDDDVVVHWYATDMDTTALQLCRTNNSIRNGIPSYYCNKNNENYDRDITQTTTPVSNEIPTAGTTAATPSASSSFTTIQTLCWGNRKHINELIETVQQRKRQQQLPHNKDFDQNDDNHEDAEDEQQLFDIIVAADIIYPSQNKQTLHDLFSTIDTLLRRSTDSYVILSYCHRDPTYQTIDQFIKAASAANFIISTCPDPHHPIYDTTLRQQYLPPLLDAQILLLHRASSTALPAVATTTTTMGAQRHNEQLGGDVCRIFPKLRTKLQSIREQQQRQIRRRQMKNEGGNDESNDEDNDDDSCDTKWDEPPLFFNDVDGTNDTNNG